MCGRSLRVVFSLPHNNYLILYVPKKGLILYIFIWQIDIHI